MKKNPNPQGKGLVPVLANVEGTRPVMIVPPKSIHQISSELFTSLFVLESKFSFKPVVGQNYYLYRKGDHYWLSLIGPEEWGTLQLQDYVGECVLQPDLTWTLELGNAATSDPALLKEIETKHRQFEQQLEQAETVAEVLPVFEESLPFYQRVFASALAYSLNLSMYKSGIDQLSYQEAVALLADQSEVS